MALPNNMSQEQNNSKSDNNALDVYLAEYESLRNEVFARFDSQRQVFNYLFTIIGASIAFLAIDKDKVFLVEPNFLILVLPILVSPLGFIFFDNELMILRISFYIFRSLRPNVIKLVNQEEVLLMGKLGFTYLHELSSKVHILLSYGRWSLFLLPTIVPIVYVLFCTNIYKRFPYNLVFIIDILAAILLIFGVVSAVIEQKKWRNLQYFSDIHHNERTSSENHRSHCWLSKFWK